MSLPSSQPLKQADLTQLDHFLRSNSCGQEAMGLSYAHGFLTAVASGPERLDSAEWLRLVFDEPVFESGGEAEAMLNLALRLFHDIDHRLKTNVGFMPIFDHIRNTANQQYTDAQPWCLGFTDGIKLFSEHWTEEAYAILKTPVALIFRLADMHSQPDPAYARLCDAVTDAAEYIYCYWQKTTKA